MSCFFTFKACVGGTWGAGCKEQCNCLLEEDVCDRFKGSCSSGCNTEYGGLSCNLGSCRYCSKEPNTMCLISMATVLGVSVYISFHLGNRNEQMIRKWIVPQLLISLQLQSDMLVSNQNKPQHSVRSLFKTHIGVQYFFQVIQSLQSKWKTTESIMS